MDPLLKQRPFPAFILRLPPTIKEPIQIHPNSKFIMFDHNVDVTLNDWGGWGVGYGGG
jgi:hypothetical protein